MLNFLRNLLTGDQKVKKVDIGSRFQLVNRVGQGSMSKVWRAVDLRTSKTVALKILDMEKTRRLESRFLRMKTPKPTEGEIAYTLRHPNIIQTLDYGITTSNEQFVVMEYIDGMSLDYLVDVQSDAMKRNCLKLIVELGDAIEYFHKQGWIHRDICPRNVVVDHSFTPKLIDFGLVVPNIEEYQAPGNRTGTAMYMAPELVKRQKTDQRIDIFSYAVTCFQMYARELPWPGGGESLETVVQRINLEPKSLRKLVPHIDPIIAKAIMKGLARDPQDRWQSMTKMLEPLRYVLENSSDHFE
jgi:eukaryotic-like serine/threonine-protein kinase